MSLAQPLSHFEPFPVDDDLEWEDLITEDNEPLDSLFAEKQQHLLTDSLYSSKWIDRPFLAMANVGLFFDKHLPPLVPDVLVSLDVQDPEEGLLKKSNHSYYLWKYGKPPEVVIEIVSDKRGGEATTKLRDYANLGVYYYVIFDPNRRLDKKVLRLYELYGTKYLERVDKRLTRMGLELRLWQGRYKGSKERWLRWQTEDKKLILTGLEGRWLAEQQAQTEALARWEAEQRASDAEQRATFETQARLAAEAEIAHLKALLEQHR